MRTGRRSGGSAWRRGRAGARAAPGWGPRSRSRSRPGRRSSSRSRPRSAISGSSAFRTNSVLPGLAGHQLGPLVGERLELAVAVELVAEEVREHDQARPQLVRRPWAARPRRPRRAPRRPRCSSSAVATPQVMFEPARLCTGTRPAAFSAAAIIPDVVVLPLVALTTVDPPVSPAPRRAMASGAIRSSTRPGRVVPPPRPLRRLRLPVARASGDLGAEEGAHAAGERTPSGAITRRARRSRRTVAGRSVRWSPSA